MFNDRMSPMNQRNGKSGQGVTKNVPVRRRRLLNARLLEVKMLYFQSSEAVTDAGRERVNEL